MLGNQLPKALLPIVIDSEALYDSESNLRNRKRFEFVSESNPESEASNLLGWEPESVPEVIYHKYRNRN